MWRALCSVIKGSADRVLHEFPDSLSFFLGHADAHAQVAKAIVRVMGCCVVAKRGLHPVRTGLPVLCCGTLRATEGSTPVLTLGVAQNVELLLRRVHERLLHLDMDLMQDPDHLVEHGWGQKGFDKVDDLDEMLKAFGALCRTDLQHAELVFRVFTLTMVIDGKLSRQENGMFRSIAATTASLNPLRRCLTGSS